MKPVSRLNSIKLPLEVPCFLLVFGFSFAESITSNLILYRTCYVSLNYDKAECALLGSNHPNNNTPILEQMVQPYATQLLMTRAFIQTIVSVIPCVFLGPWSDKYGRKPVFLLTSAGFTLSFAIVTIFCALPHISPWFYLLSGVPLCIVGGFPVIILALLAYVTDTVPEEDRAVRLGVIEAVLTFGNIIATASSSFALNSTSYFIVYLISTSCILLSFIMTLFYIPESLKNPEKKNKLKNLIKISVIKDSVATTLTRRENNQRALLLIVIAAMVTQVIAVVADANLTFLYFRQKLQWSLENFTLYGSGMHVLAVVYSITGSYFLYKLLHIKESILILIGFLCSCCGSILQGLAVTDWHVYLSGIIGCFGAIVNPMTRSLVSKIIPQEDSGKVFSLVIISETLFSLSGVPIYTFIYNQTLTTFPGAFKFVSAGVFILEALLSIPMIIMQ